MSRFDRFLRGCLAAAVATALAGCGGGDDAGQDSRGALVSQVRTASLERSRIDATLAAIPGLETLIGGPARCDVSLHQGRYATRDPKGREALASLGLLVPTGCPGPYPVLLYHHGTQMLRAATMADPSLIDVVLINGFFGAQGYVVVMPDYLGYGDSSLDYHPYLDAENMAVTSVDALRAARQMLRQLEVPVSDRLFLSGYSQGGHSTLATHRAMERDHPIEFPITASAPMAGFYSLSTTFAEAIDAPTDLAPVLFTFGLTALQRNYGDVYASPADAFRSPWASSVEGLLPGDRDIVSLVSTALPASLLGPGGLLTDGFAETIARQPDSGVRRRLAQNDVIDWRPKAPLTMCHGGRDPVVRVRNMALAQAAFRAQGAAVGAVDVEERPEFRPLIDAQVEAAGGLATYHTQIAPLLCLSVVKREVFDPRR